MLSFWLWKGNDKRQAPHVIGATCDPGPLLISWSTTSNDDTIFVTQYSIQYMIQYMWCNVLVYLPPALSCLVYIKLWCTNSYRTSSNVLTWWGWGTLWSLEMSWMDGNQYSPLGYDYTLFDPKTYVRTISGQKKLILSLVIEVGNSDALWTSGWQFWGGIPEIYFFILEGIPF